MTLKVYASSFAGFIGKNPYTKQHEVFESTWKKFSPETYAAALQRNGHTTDQQRLETLRQSIPEVDVAIYSAENSLNSSASSVSQNHQSLSVDPSVDLSPHEKKLVDDEIRKQLFTRYGTARERSVIDMLSKEMGMVFTKGIEEVTHTKHYVTPNGTVWRLAGKIDGLTDDGMTLVEIKNRVKRLFMRATDYERIQVECYLRLLESTERALLVEALSLDGNGTTLNIIPIERNDDLWTEWHHRAEIYIEYLHRVIESQGLQDAYFQSKTPSAFLRKVLG
jgi:hypothetical protein